MFQIDLPSVASSSTPRQRRRSRPTLLCFSHLRWNFVYQRPQHLLSRAAKTFDVTFIEEPVFGAGEAPRLELSTRPEGVTIAVPVLPEGTSPGDAVRLQRIMVDELAAHVDPSAMVAWYYTPMALPFTRHLKPAVTIYDNMDELSAFRGASPELLSLERELLTRADLVFTGGVSLYEAKRGRHGNLHAFPSSIDARHFGQARAATMAEPTDLAAIARPRLGFFGVIDERMDLDLVAGIAQVRPDWQVVMIGPVVKIDPESLPRAANIHWLGAKDYRDLPAYLSAWDVGIMPFALNESTRFISPTKTPEFLAAGVPVVSTAITDVVRPYGERGLVEIADDAQAFCEAAGRCMARDPFAFTAEVDRFLDGNSWDGTWSRMLGLIREASPDRDETHKRAGRRGDVVVDTSTSAGALHV